MLRGIALAIMLSQTLSAAAASDWPAFRGPTATGEADRGVIPANIGEPPTLAWTADLPGRGPSSPIVIGERVIVTASSGAREDRLHVLCFSAKTGESLWHRQFWATGRTFCHPTTANATPTPASDGVRVYAFYSSNDMACLTLDGEFCWFRGLAYDHPKAGNDVGMSSSPVVVDATVIAQVENKANSFAIGLDTVTGQTRWEIERPAESNWASPILASAKRGGPIAILQSPTGLTAVDPATGTMRWAVTTDCSTIPSPTAMGDFLVAAADGVTAYRLPPSAETPKFAWRSNRLQPATNSPVIAGGSVFSVNGAGVLTAVSLANGNGQWRLRLKGPVWATPVVAGNRMLVVSGRGLMQVVEIAEGQGKLVHTLDLADTIQATPAVTNAGVFVRSDKKLRAYRE